MNRLSTLLCAALLVGCSNQPASTPASQQSTTTNTVSATTTSPEALEHERKGETLFDNVRFVEAAEEFKQALALDPNFALARVQYAQTLQGIDAIKEADAAEAASKNLPEAERLLIEGLAAGVRGDLAKSRTPLTRVTELVPGDWRGHFLLGQTLLFEQKYSEAAASLKKATEINPNAGAAQNMLGYTLLAQDDADGAVAAFTEYVRVMPQEANAQDSLGEALMAAGKFTESQAAFQKALDLSPQFWNAHQGMAYAKFYAGDWTGGRDALAKAVTVATRAVDKVGVMQEMAAAAAAQKNTAEALRILDAADKVDGAQPTDTAFIPEQRAIVLIAAGRSREALVPLAAALSMADSGQAGPVRSRNLRRAALRARITAEAWLRNVAAAEKTVAALDQDAAAQADDPQAQSAMHYGRGQLAMAKGDAAGAKSHFDRCSGQDTACKAEDVAAAEKAGDKAATAAAREQLLRIYERDPSHLLIRSRTTSSRTP